MDKQLPSYYMHTKQYDVITHSHAKLSLERHGGLKSPVTRLFIQQFAQDQNTKAPYPHPSYWSGGFPSQVVDGAKSVSMSWRHHRYCAFQYKSLYSILKRMLKGRLCQFVLSNASLTLNTFINTALDTDVKCRFDQALLKMRQRPLHILAFIVSVVF